MNRNLMIGKEFFEMQRFAESHDDSELQGGKAVNESNPENLRMRLYREVYEI